VAGDAKATPRGAAGNRRWLILALVAFGLLAAFIALQVAARIAKSHIESLLGPHSHWSSIDVGVQDVVIHDFSEDALEGWPTNTEITAKRVTFVTKLSSLLHQDPVVIKSAVVSDGTATLVREKEGLELFPVLLRRGEPKPEPATGHGLYIERIVFENMHVDFFDRTVRQKNFDIVLAPASGTLEPVTLPSAGSTIGLSFASPVLAPNGAPNGNFELKGTFSPRQGSDLNVEFRSVGVQSAMPYLDKAGDTGISSGRIDLSARSVVEDAKINATGVLTLHDLRIGNNGSLSEQVMGLPRRIAIDRLSDRKGDIVLHFTIQGNEKDPHFSLNESASMRFSAGVAEALGVPVEALAKGVGSVGEQGLDAAGHVASGVGDVVKDLLPHPSASSTGH
jgi:hypothetical protein